MAIFQLILIFLKLIIFLLFNFIVFRYQIIKIVMDFIQDHLLLLIYMMQTINLLKDFFIFAM